MAEEFVKVTHCGNCPFSTDLNDIDDYCSHPDADPENTIDIGDASIADNPPPPHWCPLRKQGILISLNLD